MTTLTKFTKGPIAFQFDNKSFENMVTTNIINNNKIKKAHIINVLRRAC